MEWQPIENAPKNGTPILLYQDGQYTVSKWLDASYQEQRLVSARGRRETYEWVDVAEGYWDHEDGDIYDPTHWAPLSPPDK